MSKKQEIASNNDYLASKEEKDIRDEGPEAKPYIKQNVSLKKEVEIMKKQIRQLYDQLQAVTEKFGAKIQEIQDAQDTQSHLELGIESKSNPVDEQSQSRPRVRKSGTSVSKTTASPSENNETKVSSSSILKKYAHVFSYYTDYVVFESYWPSVKKKFISSATVLPKLAANVNEEPLSKFWTMEAAEHIKNWDHQQFGISVLRLLRYFALRYLPKDLRVIFLEPLEIAETKFPLEVDLIRDLFVMANHSLLEFDVDLNGPLLLSIANIHYKIIRNVTLYAYEILETARFDVKKCDLSTAKQTVKDKFQIMQKSFLIAVMRLRNYSMKKGDISLGEVLDEVRRNYINGKLKEGDLYPTKLTHDLRAKGLIRIIDSDEVQGSLHRYRYFQHNGK